MTAAITLEPSGATHVLNPICYLCPDCSRTWPSLPQPTSLSHKTSHPINHSASRSPTSHLPSPPSSDGLLQRAPQPRGAALKAQGIDANDSLPTAYAAAPSPTTFATPHPIRCKIQPRFKPPGRRPPRTPLGGQERGRNTPSNPSRWDTANAIPFPLFHNLTISRRHLDTRQLLANHWPVLKRPPRAGSLTPPDTFRDQPFGLRYLSRNSRTTGLRSCCVGCR